MNEIIQFYGAKLLVFDGNAPFQGLIDAADANPQMWSIWCRRGMWVPGAGDKFLDREQHFDAVLEPRDIVEDLDVGPTRERRARARLVDPIRLLDDHELLPRDLARTELGLDPEGLAVLVQLGSRNNFGYDVAQWQSIERLVRGRSVQIVAAEWLMADRSIAPEAQVKVVRAFPLSRYFRAFDASVSAVGYNSYHELIQARLPTLFIPNENPRQDNQLARARFAERHGLALCARAHEVYRLDPAMDRLLDPAERQAMAIACARFARPNGAVEAARMIEELAFVMRTEAVAV